MTFKIFPVAIIHGQKVPLIKGWNELASSDPLQIRAWQDQFRDRIQLWGVPCGAVNGIFALDIDVKKVNGWDSLNKLGYEIPNTMSQRTPSGGSHFLFKTKPGVHYGNTVNIDLGLDTRGDRGWIGYYGLTHDVPLAEAPDWLFNLSPKPKTVETQGSFVRLAPEIAAGILESCLENIRTAAPGESNNILNVESFKVGQLVASGNIERAVAEQELFKAAKDRGKPDYESRATIKSGLDGGLKSPITCPFPPSEPIAGFKIPEVPGVGERWTPRFFTKADLLNTSKLRKPQLFQDWSAEDIQITTADGGTGKTTLKLYEAICLALGDRFLGFDCKQTGRTLFITGEDTAEKLAAMMGAIIKQMGLFEPSPDNETKIQTILSSIVIKKDADLCLIKKDKQGFLQPNSEAMEKLLQAVNDVRPKLIVFDPIASFWGSESALNDMNKAVTKFMSELVERSHASVEMINHMGKTSSQTKDMTQFAGRGGTGLPSNSRISRTLMGLKAEEFTEMTGETLAENESAMICNVNKFSDGSPLLNKPFVIIRRGYLFSRKTLSPQKAREAEEKMSDIERIFTFIKEARSANKYVTLPIVIANFMSVHEPISEARIKRTISLLGFSGHLGEKIKAVDNPDLTVRDRVFVITDSEGRET